MNLDEETRLARLEYIRAVARVRSAPSAESWARLRMAARELQVAIRGGHGHRASPHARRTSQSGTPRRHGGGNAPRLADL